MILPSKHVSEDHALIGVGGLLLHCLDKPQSVTSLWHKVRDVDSVGTFERFVLALDLLHITGAVRLNRGMLELEMP